MSRERDEDMDYERGRQLDIDADAEARRRNTKVRAWDQLADDIEAVQRRIAPQSYFDRVRAYEDQGMTTSDAQAVVDAEDLKAGRA